MERDAIKDLSIELGHVLLKRHLHCAVAESCTGGGIAFAITAVSGSSQWFDRGFVTYSNASKMEVLGVRADLLQKDGAVSEVVVRAMAEGTIAKSQADIAVAVSGIAGPHGGSALKPVGSVWFAWANRTQTTAQYYLLKGDREAVRSEAVVIALKGLIAQALSLKK